MKLIRHSTAPIPNPQFLLPLEFLDFIWSESRRQHFPFWLFLGLCLNLVVAPAVFALSGEAIARTTAYAIGILGLVTIALSVYLFVVIFQPERF